MSNGKWPRLINRSNTNILPQRTHGNNLSLRETFSRTYLHSAPSRVDNFMIPSTISLLSEQIANCVLQPKQMTKNIARRLYWLSTLVQHQGSWRQACTGTPLPSHHHSSVHSCSQHTCISEPPLQQSKWRQISNPKRRGKHDVHTAFWQVLFWVTMLPSIWIPTRTAARLPA